MLRGRRAASEIQMTMISMECSDCKGVNKVNSFIFRVRKKTGLEYTCEHCGSNLNEGGVKLHKKSRGTDSQKRSRKQEKRLARDLGGRVQPASGAGSAKGDVRVAGDVRAECKLTRAKSFNLKLSDLEKIEGEASGEEMPLLHLEFQGVSPHKKYVVLPYWAFQSLMEEQ